jgi:predicted nicotinamide N-methyase
VTEGLAGRHPLRRRDLSVAGRAFRIWHLPEVDSLLDALLAKGPDHPDVRDEKLPYWAEIWPSSLALAHHVLSTPAWSAGWAAVELGCGPGLSGLAAQARGASVLFTDWLPEALELAALNVRENLDQPACTRLLDWRNPPGDVQADLLLASDCLYEARVFEPLWRTFDALLRPGGRVWLSEPGREVARAFFTDSPARGWRTHRFPCPPEAPQVWELTRAGS